jgi:hypothetical protein
VIPWCAGGQQGNAGRIESYSQAGLSGVPIGAEVSLGHDYPSQTPRGDQATDHVRVVAGGLPKHRDPATLPTPGQILAALSDQRVGGVEYDRAWPQRAAKSLW